MNMDYALCGMLQYKNFDPAQGFLFGYDVNCQYSINFMNQVENSVTLQVPDELDIIHAIGTFHVHSHKEECYPRYGTMFIPGAAITSMEILEVRWSSYNPAAPSLCYMSLAHRSEMLDLLMGDTNWKTIVSMGRFLLSVSFYNPLTILPLGPKLAKGYLLSLSEVDTAEREFKAIDGTIVDDQREEWLAMEEEAQIARKTNVAAMDVYNPASKPGITYCRY